MYTQFYGLREKPFSLSPDPKYLYLSDSHREALAHLLYGIEQGEGFIAITGEVGTGKTTLCRTLLQRLEPGTEVAFIFNPQLSGLELLQAISAELGLETGDASRRELTENLNRFLLAKRREGRRVLLIVDEAQTLDRDALEQVRLLSNLETNTAKLIQIILIGQPELDTILESPDLRQLRQRISVRWRLQPLSVAETRAYVNHRLRIAAGAPREIFTDLSLREIHRRSRGIPRVINLLCDRSLLAGYASGAKAIGLGLVAETDREVRGGPRARSVASVGGGIPWLNDRLSSAPDWVRRGVVPAAVVVLLAAAGLAGFLLGGDDAAEVEGASEVVAVAPEARRIEASGELPEADRADALPPVAAQPPAEGEPSDAPGPEPVSSPPPNEAPAAGSEPARGGDLGVTLARISPAASAAASLDALLTHWSKAPLAAGVMSPTGVVAALREAGFAIWNLEGATLDDLARIDRPALLRVDALDGAERLVLVDALDEERVTLAGLGARKIVFDRSAVESLWTGRAIVPWLEAAPLPDVIGPWSKGEPVLWLQDALGHLGHYDGTPNGEFDLATLAGVRALQGELGIHVDGTVGPETRIRMQDAAGFAVPRLGARTGNAQDAEPVASDGAEPGAAARSERESESATADGETRS